MLGESSESKDMGLSGLLVEYAKGNTEQIKEKGRRLSKTLFPMCTNTTSESQLFLVNKGEGRFT